MPTIEITPSNKHLNTKDADYLKYLKEIVMDELTYGNEERKKHYERLVKEGIRNPVNPEIKCYFEAQPVRDNCGAYFISNIGFTVCGRHMPTYFTYRTLNLNNGLWSKFQNAPASFHKSIAKAISEKLKDLYLTGDGKSLILATDAIKYDRNKQEHKLNFPVRFMYLAAFAPAYWKVNSTSAVGNPNHNSSTTIFSLSMHKPKSRTRRQKKIEEDFKNNPFFKNVKVNYK